MFGVGVLADHSSTQPLYGLPQREDFGQSEYGAVFSYHRLGISVSETLLTAQYAEGPFHQVR